MGIRTWTEKEEEYLRSSYGIVGYPEIRATLAAHTPSAIASRARKLGVKSDQSLAASIRRTGHRRHTINSEYFSQVNIDSCYWAGFIAADGCVIHDSPYSSILRVQLSRKDREHLELMKKALKYSGDIKDRVTKCGGKEFPSSVLSMRVNRSMAIDMKKSFGVTARKSLTLRPPSISKSEHVASFIVGYIDGDGSIDWSTRDESFRIGIRGTLEVLQWIKNWFDYWEPHSRMAVVGTSEIYPKYQVCGKRSKLIAQRLLELSPLHLKRKWKAISQTFRSKDE